MSRYRDARLDGDDKTRGAASRHAGRGCNSGTDPDIASDQLDALVLDAAYVLDVVAPLNG